MGHWRVAANATAAAWLTSATRRRLRRGIRAAARRVRGAAARLHYVHRADDPYAWLLVQALPELLQRYAVTGRVHILGRRDPAMFPAPRELGAYARRDAAALAELYSLRAPPAGAEPAAAAIDAQHAALAARDPDDVAGFCAAALDTDAALWSGRAVTPGRSPISDRLARDTAWVRRKGHYASAMLYFEGEWYWGLDRLAHLERRLNAAGLARGPAVVRYDRTRERVFEPLTSPPASPPALECFLSVRSPYSYIGLHQARRFCRAHGLDLVLRPVLPMVTRGLAVPLAKRLYILGDAAREAERAGLPFGRVADPLGAGVARVLAVAMALDGARRETFLAAALTGIMARGIDAATDAGLARLAREGGVAAAEVTVALGDETWQSAVERNRSDLTNMGLWGVPCFRLGTLAVWGQDRLWRLRTHLQVLAGRP